MSMSELFLGHIPTEAWICSYMEVSFPNLDRDARELLLVRTPPPRHARVADRLTILEDTSAGHVLRVTLLDRRRGILFSLEGADREVETYLTFPLKYSTAEHTSANDLRVGAKAVLASDSLTITFTVLTLDLMYSREPTSLADATGLKEAWLEVVVQPKPSTTKTAPHNSQYVGP